jgi:H+-translocating NAD(P) transhydrogenase subunit beta
VVGANDVVNPAARHKKSSPLYGMPILDVDKAHTVIFLKRSMGAGFAGEENELFYDKKTMMVLGDAKKTLTEVAGMLKKRTGLVH